MEEEYMQQQGNSEEYISELINVDKELDQFAMRVLRGKVEILNEQKEKEWVDAYPGKKIMNERGVHGIMAILHGVVTKLSKLSNKSEDMIRQDMFYFDMRLGSLLYENCDDWDLDMGHVESLKEACIRLAEDVSYSSIDGFTAINLRSQYSKVDSTRQEVNNQKQGKKLFGISLTK